MKIISPFKDYYDYLANIYGVDDKIIYNRIPFKKEYLPVSGFRLPPAPYNRTNDKINYRWLCINGKYYLVESSSNGYYRDWKLSSKEFYADNVNNDREYRDELLKLHKHLMTPVFYIRDVYWKHIVIDDEIPILKDTGIPSIIPAEKMFVDISYFINNTLHNNPDIAPPVQVSDKDKLTQAGFDVRVSFRHRT